MSRRLSYDERKAKLENFYVLSPDAQRLIDRSPAYEWEVQGLWTKFEFLL